VISLLRAEIVQNPLGWRISSLVKNYRGDLKPARTSSEKSFGCTQAA